MPDYWTENTIGDDGQTLLSDVVIDGVTYTAGQKVQATFTVQFQDSTGQTYTAVALQIGENENDDLLYTGYGRSTPIVGYSFVGAAPPVGEELSLVGQPGFAADNAVAYSDLWGGFPPPPPPPANYTATVAGSNGANFTLDLTDVTPDQAKQQVVDNILTTQFQTGTEFVENAPFFIGRYDPEAGAVVDNGDGTYSVTVTQRMDRIYHNAGGVQSITETKTFTFSLDEPNAASAPDFASATVAGEDLTFDLNGAAFADDELTFLAAYDWSPDVTVLPDLGDLGEQEFGPLHRSLVAEFGQTRGDEIYAKVVGMQQVVVPPSANYSDRRDLGLALYQFGRVNGSYSPARAASVMPAIFAALRGDVAGSGRQLSEIDGVIDGETADQINTDARSERVGVFFQAVLNMFDGTVPNWTARDTFTFMQDFYGMTDFAPSDANWQSFFDANISADGQLAETLDLSMFEGVDATLFETVLLDGAGLFYTLQQNQQNTDPARAGSIFLAASPQLSETLFVGALRTDILQTGSSDFLTDRTGDPIQDTQWQDFTTTGLYDQDSIVNGNVDGDALANHALVKAILWTGREVMAELQARGLWEGPDPAALDSATIATDFPVYKALLHKFCEGFI
ncbi:hypothetical protein [Yoonia sp.]|uniref:hypothetical protein n=1 Tax=Yoonia sp. TaxID=2212373 RepID=UPI0025D6FE0D|nr:hypothetical protein [Yoonia sp.]